MTETDQGPAEQEADSKIRRMPPPWQAEEATPEPKDRARAWRWLGLVGLTASLATAAYAQHIIDDGGTLAESWPLLSAFDTKLTQLYRVDQSVALAVTLFFIAMVTFVLSLRGLLGAPKAETTEEDARPAWRLSWPLPAASWVPLAIGWLVSLGGWAFLIRRLVDGQYEAWYVALFYGLLFLAAALFLLMGRLGGARPTREDGIRPWEVVLVLALTGLFIGLVVPDLTNWRYAYLGDDGEFFRVAKDIATWSREWNLFSQRGPYGLHPPMSSAYQGAVMRAAGVDIFGWKLASVLAVAAALPVFYWLLRTLIESRAAAFGTAIMAVSHYLLGYAHTGYNNILAISPSVFAFALFFAGTRSNNLLFLFGSGAVAGLGFYNHFSARSAVVILALAVLSMGRRRWRWEILIPLAAGFVMAVGPMFATEGWDTIEAMRGRSAAEGRTPVELLSQLLASMPRVFLAFNFNPYPKHFVSGSLLDEISAVLALLGLGYATYRVRNEAHRFLLIWFIVAMVATGLFHQRPEEINSRLHYVLPAMAALAGLALDRVVAGFSALWPKRNLAPVLSIACFIIVMPAILGFNAHRHWVESPRRAPPSGTAVVFREVNSPSCNVEGYRSVIFARETAPSLPLVFEFYGWEERMPYLFRFDDPPSVYDTALKSGEISCILVGGPDDWRAAPTVARLASLAQQAGKPVEEATDAAGRGKVLVLRLLEPGTTSDHP